MADDIVGQPLVEVSVFECAECRKGPVRKFDKSKAPYPCPFCGTLMMCVRTEWEERHSSVMELPVEPAGLSALPPNSEKL